MYMVFFSFCSFYWLIFFPLEVGDPHISVCLTLPCVSCDSCISQFFVLLPVFCCVLFHFIFVYFSCFWHSLPHSILFYLSILSQLFSFLFPVGNLSAVHYPPLHIFPIINFVVSFWIHFGHWLIFLLEPFSALSLFSGWIKFPLGLPYLHVFMSESFEDRLHVLFERTVTYNLLLVSQYELLFKRISPAHPFTQLPSSVVHCLPLPSESPDSACH